MIPFDQNQRDHNHECVYFRFHHFVGYYHWIANKQIDLDLEPILDPLSNRDRIDRRGGEISWPRNQTNRSCTFL